MRIKNTRLRSLLFPTFLFFLAQNATAQGGSPLTLQQCIEYGLTHNPSIMKAGLETEKSDYKLTEARSEYLPQVSGSVQLIDNLKLQTMVLPGEFVGQPGTTVPVQFGTLYNLTGAVDATQKIYDQSSIEAVRIAKQNAQLSELNTQKTKEQLTYDLANAYYSAQVTLTQQNLIQANLSKVDTLLQVTRVQFENGFVKKLDVDRLQVNKTNLQTELANSKSNYEQQLMLLKYYMGMPLEETISLPEISATEKIETKLLGVDNISSTDVQILQTQQALYNMNIRQIQAGYIPTLSVAFHGAAQFQQDDLRIFSKNASWYPTSYLAFNLNIPIFDGMSKTSRISQMRVQLKQNELDQQYLNQSINMQVANAQNKLTVNLSALETQQRNIELANEVYETTRVQYSNGTIALTEMVNAENELRVSQTNYLTALVQARLAELELIKATGNYNSIK
jgi:outer membrane protein TolC